MVDSKRDFFYPPGGILIWIIVFLELTVFCIGLIVFKSNAINHKNIFLESVRNLNLYTGTANTIILLISGYFMAKTVQSVKLQLNESFKKYLTFTIIGGVLFSLLKAYEYLATLSAGHTISYNVFYTFYWLITSFHLLHVLVGIVILMYFYLKKPNNNRPEYIENLEAAAIFWHMCDLIWVLVFTVFYLYWR